MAVYFKNKWRNRRNAPCGDRCHYPLPLCEFGIICVTEMVILLTGLWAHTVRCLVQHHPNSCRTLLLQMGNPIPKYLQCHDHFLQSKHLKKTYEPRHEIFNNVVCTTSKASDQPVHMHSLIRAFVNHLNIKWLLSNWLISFGVSKFKGRLHRLVWVYTWENATLLKITCQGSYRGQHKTMIVSMTKIWHNHTLQTNPRHRKEVTQNTSWHMASEDNRKKQPALLSPVKWL